jgi:hypothetical protein
VRNPGIAVRFRLDSAFDIQQQIEREEEASASHHIPSANACCLTPVAPQPESGMTSTLRQNLHSALVAWLLVLTAALGHPLQVSGQVGQGRPLTIELTAVDITTVKTFRADQVSFLGVRLGMTQAEVSTALKGQPEIDTQPDEMLMTVTRLNVLRSGTQVAAFEWRPDDVRLHKIILLPAASSLLHGATRQLLSDDVRDSASAIRAFLGAPVSFPKEQYSELSHYNDRWIFVDVSPRNRHAQFVFVRFPVATQSQLPRPIQELMARARANDRDAQYVLGSWYERAMKQPDEAAKLFESAAKLGDARAAERLAYLYKAGDVGTKNPSMAAYWYEVAANSGHPSAQASLAEMLITGNGVRQNVAAAVQWYRRSAAQGHLPAEEGLADLYSAGNGLATNPARALVWRYRALLDAVEQVMMLKPYSTSLGRVFSEMEVKRQTEAVAGLEAALSPASRRSAARIAARWKSVAWDVVRQSPNPETLEDFEPSTPLALALSYSLETAGLGFAVALPEKEQAREARVIEVLQQRATEAGAAKSKVFVSRSIGEVARFAIFVDGRIHLATNGTAAFSAGEILAKTAEAVAILKKSVVGSTPQR